MSSYIMYVSPRKGLGDGCSKRRDARRVGSSWLPGAGCSAGTQPLPGGCPALRGLPQSSPGPAPRDAPAGKGAGLRLLPLLQLQRRGAARVHRAEAGGGGNAPSSFHTRSSPGHDPCLRSEMEMPGFYPRAEDKVVGKKSGTAESFLVLF